MLSEAFASRRIAMSNEIGMIKYNEFLEWCEGECLEFPCTENQFRARAADYAAGEWDLYLFLCSVGLEGEPS